MPKKEKTITWTPVPNHKSEHPEFEFNLDCKPRGGGFSKVYQGRGRLGTQWSGKTVAVKIVQQDEKSTREKGAPGLESVFDKEVQILTILHEIKTNVTHAEGKKHIIELLGWGKSYTSLNGEKVMEKGYMVFLWVERNLFDYVCELPGQRLKPVELQKCLLQILSAIAYMTERGVIHQDLKLDNILVDESSKQGASFLISDFGLAKKIGDREMPFASGAREFCPPELLFVEIKSFNGKEYEEQGGFDTHDSWSFGCVALGTGFPLFSEKIVSKSHGTKWFRLRKKDVSDVGQPDAAAQRRKKLAQDLEKSMKELQVPEDVSDSNRFNTRVGTHLPVLPFSKLVEFYKVVYGF
ncbi:kinase-like protein [Meredithblackwellia eburnea MCA 4105]